MGVTPPSTCPWLDHPVSGPRPATRAPCSDSLSLRLRLAAWARRRPRLADPLCKRYAVTRPRTRGSESGPDCSWASGFRISFTPLVGVLFTFPSRYWFAIGRRGVLRLGGWSPRVRTGFHVSRPTRGRRRRLTRTGLSPAAARLSRRFRFLPRDHWPGPRSLAATDGVSVDVLSSGY